MPELPEVEITRRQIEPLLSGRVIATLATTADSYFFITKPALLKRKLKGRAIERVERVGKYLLAHVDDGQRLLLHLGMTGQLFGAGVRSVRLLSSTGGAALSPEGQQAFHPDAHTHIRFSFADGGQEVYFRDARKFGKVQLLAPGEACERLDRLGVDALLATGEHLHAGARGRRAAIKNLLLDQAVIAGIGNIYADEGLFLAGVRPTTPAGKLSRPACARIVDACRTVMLRSIETGGSSISDYVHPDGSDGGYQDERRVYAREGEPCLQCGAPIKRIVLGQRSAHYCPRCQR
jgi:formamidopyrimidine-DNA glycosylase